MDSAVDSFLALSTARLAPRTVDAYRRDLSDVSARLGGSPADAERLIEAAAGTTPRSLRDRALLELLYGAGLRVSEAVGLERASVDLENRLVRCIGKGSKERVVPIGREAAD